mmetsp:Transcript_76666/g.119795  ORF Transcript_76666/g.119795 Transcript_76666/m.119795 type:complete len:222 (+) Transcript_76666:827-1492(+)
MPSSRAPISEASVAMVSSRSAIALPRSETVSWSSLRSSSFLSIVFSQYSFFSSSATCSLPSNFTISSIITSTLSKLTFLPFNAKEIRLMRKSPFPSCNMAKARDFIDCPDAANCNSEGVGNVFLKSSRLSSSFNNFIVSAIANNSSARTLHRTAHSSSFVLQFFSRSLKKASSSKTDFVVSSRSSFAVTNATPSSPIFVILLSMDFVKALISLVLALMSSS